MLGSGESRTSLAALAVSHGFRLAKAIGSPLVKIESGAHSPEEKSIQSPRR